MPDTLTHPAARSVHAVNNALQIINGMIEASRTNAQSLRMDASDLRRLIEEVPADIAALYQDNEAKAAEILELQKQGVREKQYIDRIEDRNTALNELLIAANNRLAAASREVEQLLAHIAEKHQAQTIEFNRIRGLRDTLDPSVSIIGDGGDYIIMDRPRTAAAGGR
jgi:chromosome segregation ATPase